jgi:hypothetical protein
LPDRFRACRCIYRTELQICGRPHSYNFDDGDDVYNRVFGGYRLVCSWVRQQVVVLVYVHRWSRCANMDLRQASSRRGRTTFRVVATDGACRTKMLVFLHLQLSRVRVNVTCFLPFSASRRAREFAKAARQRLSTTESEQKFAAALRLRHNLPGGLGRLHEQGCEKQSFFHAVLPRARGS